jgi:hypothetical protein
MPNFSIHRSALPLGIAKNSQFTIHNFLQSQAAKPSAQSTVDHY